MSTIESINLIYRDPKVRGGRPCIVDTDLRVLDIVISKIFSERTPDELAQDYDLSMAEVHASLAYYYCNKDEIDSDICDDFKRSEELAQIGFSEIERPVFEDVNLERKKAAIKYASELEAKAKQAMDPVEQETG